MQDMSKSIRKIGSVAGISKSSTHRHKKAIENRNLYPESGFWEKETGYQWLQRLVFVTVFIFGIKHSVGAEAISEFFKLLRLDRHVGVSPSAIRNMRKQIESNILKYQQAQENKCRDGKAIEITAGADEVFFEEVTLVMLDLSSGFIFVEETAKNRTFETWKETAQAALNKYQIKIKNLVSDRAKALIKLAIDGYDCLSIPDLFHAMHEIVKTMGLGFHRCLARVEKKLVEAHAQLACSKEKGKDIEQIMEKEKAIDDLQAQKQAILAGKKDYKVQLYNISKTVHPFDISGNGAQTSQKIETSLKQSISTIENIALKYNISNDKGRLNKFGSQIHGIASLIDSWWLWAKESLAHHNLESNMKFWLLYILLPVIYWQKQAERTKTPELKAAYQTIFEQKKDELISHPITSTLGEKKLMNGRIGLFGLHRNFNVHLRLLKEETAAYLKSTIVQGVFLVRA